MSGDLWTAWKPKTPESNKSVSLLPRSSTGSRLGEKTAQGRLDTDFLDGALADFSGDVAADALDDGPCCLLSAVANRRSKRLLADV